MSHKTNIKVFAHVTTLPSFEPRFLQGLANVLECHSTIPEFLDAESDAPNVIVGDHLPDAALDLVVVHTSVLPAERWSPAPAFRDFVVHPQLPAFDTPVRIEDAADVCEYRSVLSEFQVANVEYPEPEFPLHEQLQGFGQLPMQPESEPAFGNDEPVRGEHPGQERTGNVPECELLLVGGEHIEREALVDGVGVNDATLPEFGEGSEAGILLLVDLGANDCPRDTPVTVELGR